MAYSHLSKMHRLLDGQYSPKVMVKNLQSCNAYALGGKLYQCYHTRACLQALGNALMLDFTRKYMTKEDIRLLVQQN